MISWFHLCMEPILGSYILFYITKLELKVIIKKLPNTNLKTPSNYFRKYLKTFVLVPISNINNSGGRSDLAPMTPLIPFGMNSNSSQLLDLLQALRFGQFLFCLPSRTSRLPIKKIYSTAQIFQTPTTYLHPTKNLKPHHHSRTQAMLEKTVLRKWCWSATTKNNVAKATLKQCYRIQGYRKRY